jgi:hypothetical protein
MAGAVAGALVAASTACGGGSSAAPRPLVTSSTAPRATTSTTAPPIAPLTGLPDATGRTVRRPALSVKIDNAPEARPQAGLDKADVVFEEVVEGGITRFLTIFHSQGDGPVGPVRSVRPMDPQIVTPLGGLFAYSGGTPDFIAMLHRAPVQDVGANAAGDAYYRDKGRAAPHNLFSTGDHLWSRARTKFSAPPQPLFTFLPAGTGFTGTPAGSVTIPFSQMVTVSYVYDATDGTWKRSQNGTPHVAASGAQIGPVNVVVEMVHEEQTTKVDRAGFAVPQAVVVGAGDAWVLSAGRVVKARWVRPSVGVPARLVDAAGAPVALTPGPTWVHLAPVGTAISIR